VRRGRSAALLALLALLAVGCGEAAAPAEPTGPDPERIRAARETLGEPMLAVARAVLSAERALDAVRHEVPRGRDMAGAVDGLSHEAAALQEAAAAAEAAGTEVADEPEPVAEAADVVATAAAAARSAAGGLEQEAAALAGAAAHDVALDAAVDRWAEPGSQSQRRAALDALAGDLDAARTQAQGLQPVPEGCPGLAERRVRWTEVLAQRTRRLGETATSAGGSTFDELLASFRRDPYAEPRLRADAEDRGCWREHSEVVQAAAEIRELVERLEALLNP
jgi:hypothetical protein